MSIKLKEGNFKIWAYLFAALMYGAAMLLVGRITGKVPPIDRVTVIKDTVYTTLPTVIHPVIRDTIRIVSYKTKTRLQTDTITIYREAKPITETGALDISDIGLTIGKPLNIYRDTFQDDHISINSEIYGEFVERIGVSYRLKQPIISVECPNFYIMPHAGVRWGKQEPDYFVGIGFNKGYYHSAYNFSLISRQHSLSMGAVFKF